MQFCSVLGCSQKSQRRYCYLHRHGNQLTPVPTVGFLEYCSPEVRAWLSLSYRLRDTEWRRFVGDQLETEWCHLPIKIENDGTAHPFVSKLRSVSSNGRHLLTLDDLYCLRWYRPDPVIITHPESTIIQARISRDWVYYLTSKCELYRYDRNHTRTLIHQNVTLFHHDPNYANLWTLRGRRLYDGEHYLGVHGYRRFVGYDGVELTMELRSRQKVVYPVTAKPHVSGTGVLL